MTNYYVKEDGTSVKILRFNCRYIEPILIGNKCITIRYELDDDVERGDEMCMATPNDFMFGFFTVDKLSIMSAHKIARLHLDGHKSYKNTKHFLRHIARYYPDESRHFDNTTMFDVMWMRDIEMSDAMRIGYSEINLVDFDGNCAACGVNERKEDSRYCKSCHEVLVDG